MEEQVTFIYCLADELLKALEIEDDQQCKMTSPEIVTFAILTAIYHQGNYRKARNFCRSLNYFRFILSQSRMNRRIHSIDESIWLKMFYVCREILRIETVTEHIVDSFPVASCQNYKIFRCHLFKGEEYRGYTASKKAYFWGIKVHMVTDVNGVPLEFIFTPGSCADVSIFKDFTLDSLPDNSLIFGDKAYNDYFFEDLLKDVKKIHLLPHRKRNAKRKNSLPDEFKLKYTRSKIETFFSAITALMPRTIRARTAKGFLLKVFLFILGYTVKLSF